MKKFTPSLIIPIFYIAAASLAALYGLVNGFIIIAVGYLLIIALNLGALFMIDLYDMDLKHNLIAYIISVIISLIVVLVSIFVFDAFLSEVFMFAVPIVNTILMTLGFYFDKDKKEREALVWFLLNPNIYYIIVLIFFILQLNH